MHALAELQTERALLWTILLPMNIVMHPRDTWAAFQEFDRDGKASEKPGSPGFPANTFARHVLLTQMLDSGIPIPTNLPPPANQLIAIRQEALLFLAALQNYIMPVLFGLLGACVQVLRTVNNRIESFTYLPGARSRYYARLVLGMVAGPAINWMFDTDGKLLGFTGATPASAVALTSHLPPIVLAFVAGYGVEILFSIMDRFIAVFRDQPASADHTRERKAAVLGM